ncbi:MAG: GspH/FimT family pseudopilin [Pseudomonadota bacterium]|nr:GspH/FimT family pseudopilin [Pseudomonadota bacterium]
MRHPDPAMRDQPPRKRLPPQHGYARAGGFTLIEMLVTVAVLMTLAVVAGATFSGTVSGYRIAGAANSLARDFQYARAEALRRGLPVSVCASTNGTSCSGSTAWASGWIVFFDANGNGAIDAGDSVLRAETQSTGNTTLAPDNGTTTGVTFNRQGSVVALPNAVVTFKLHEASGNAALTRCITLVPSGRSSIVNAGNGNCS